MSSSGVSEADRLREELRALRAEFRLLTVRVDQQEDRLSELSAQSLRGSISAGSPSVVGEPEGSRAESQVSSGYQVVSTPGTSSVPEVDEVGPYSWVERERVAVDIGHFIVRALTGQQRGNSGRDRIKGLKSRYYLVIRDKYGQEYRNPTKVFTNYQQCKHICANAGDFGDSIFVGVPSIKEGKLVAETAGLGWPLSFN